MNQSKKFMAMLTYSVLMIMLLSLGRWQWQRADEKQKLFDEQKIQSFMGPAEFVKIDSDDVKQIRYRKVQLTGRYDIEHQFFLDNQIHQGKPGYYILTPFIILKLNKAVLINRGWYPLGNNRVKLPNLPLNPELKTIEGRINSFPSIGLKLPGATTPVGGWPALIQVVDINVLAEKLDYPLYSYQIELAPEMPDGFVRDWQISQMIRPEQHLAYAWQWFGLAATLTVLFVAYLRKNYD